ncbi:MAG: nitroreductase family protein [Phycisphaerae bacterium]|nr:nitroreductase family protein [Phycisphaerae bacterium]
MKKTVMTAVTLAWCSWPCLGQAVGEGPLPGPLVTGNSVELCLNSRYSQHSLSGTATAQHISNVVWAAGRMPVTGTRRDIHVMTRAGTFLYDPNGHSLTRYSNEVTNDGAFAIRYEADRIFDAGAMMMPAMLAAASLCNSPLSPMASCPKGMGYPRTRLILGVQPGKALTGQLVVHSSVQEGQTGWLPDPCTTGDNSLEQVLAHLAYGSRFVQTDLTDEQVSQILWAGYGCSAHMTTNGRAGLTVPSAMANYYLTGTIYLVDGTGVYRYVNRNPATNLATRDHRLEAVTPSSVGGRRQFAADDANLPDARATLQSAVSGLPGAPCYAVLCLNSANVGQEYAQLETGFVAGNMLIQASAIGLGCHFRPGLTAAQQKAVQSATSIPAANVPQVIVSLGPLLAWDADQDGTVDLSDLACLSRSWLASRTQAEYDPYADIDRNGVVNTADLSLLGAHWLETVP